jgi:hypothetical protein
MDKHPHHHIKKHLAKGHTLNFIKRELKILGYQEKHIESLIKSYLINHHFAKPILISLIPLILLISLLSIEPTITGNVVFLGSCTPKWECTNWYPPRCPLTGIQTRICTELEACTTNKPSEMRKCVHISEVKDYNKQVSTTPHLKPSSKLPSAQQPTNLSSKIPVQQAKTTSMTTKKPAQTQPQEPFSPGSYMRFHLILVMIVTILTFFIYFPHRENYIIRLLNDEVVQLDKLSKQRSEKAIKKTKKLYSKIYAKYLNLIRLPRAQSRIIEIYNKINGSHLKLAKQIKSYKSNTLNKLKYCNNLINQIKENINNTHQAVDLYYKLYNTYIELTKQNIDKRKIKNLYKKVLQTYKTLKNI